MTSSQSCPSRDRENGKSRAFTHSEYQTLRDLCDLIIPADSTSPGALDASAPEFIDLIASENERYRLKLVRGLTLLDEICQQRYCNTFIGCSDAQRDEVLTLIAYRQHCEVDPSLRGLVDFFAMLRRSTVDAFVTSKCGIDFIGYKGNMWLDKFPGCPPFANDGV